jgi:hypothetical protein
MARRTSENKSIGGGGNLFPKNSIALFLLLVSSQIGAPCQGLHLNMIATSLPASILSTPAPTTIPTTKKTVIDVPMVKQLSNINFPSIELSSASTKEVNKIYTPQSPSEIPRGFARMCGKAGGFAPRPIWNDITNGITPWFESKSGEFIYFNCNDRNWYVDNAFGAALYVCTPESLLLPPTNGWVSLTGRRVGAPKMSFFCTIPAMYPDNFNLQFECLMPSEEPNSG